MNKKIDGLISQLTALKTPSNKHDISKALLKKWEESYTVSELQKNTTISELRLLCNYFDLKESGEKKLLANRLWEHWESADTDESDNESGDEVSDDESGDEKDEWETDEDE